MCVLHWLYFCLSDPELRARILLPRMFRGDMCTWIWRWVLGGWNRSGLWDALGMEFEIEGLRRELGFLRYSNKWFQEGI